MKLKRRPRRAGCLAAALCFSNCSPNLPPTYVKNAEAASAAYSAGHYLQAANRWAEAAGAAPSEKHRGESRYRQATSLWKGGRPEAAKRLFQVLKSKPGTRQARAAFDYAYLCLDADNAVEGYAALRSAVMNHPESGNVDRALRVLVERERSTAGETGAVAFLRRLQSALNGTGAEQSIRYFLARLLEDSHQTGPALQEYEVLRTRFPYPQGMYWDEATLRSVELLLESGKVDRAANLLKDMLGAREGSAIVGSYERRFSTAHFRLAEVYRDEKNDWRRARAEFRRLFEIYETSLLRDDSLWEASLLSLKNAEPNEACNDMKRLLELPDSRFQRCAALVCGSLKKDGSECPAYLRTEIATRGTM